MIEQVAEVNRNLQICLFVVYVLSTAATILMGWHIFLMNKDAVQNRKALKLFLVVAVWTQGFGCIGVIEDIHFAENVVHIALVASAMWLVWCPEYLMQSAFFSHIGKKHRVLHYVIYASVILFIVSMIVKHNRAQFVYTYHGMAYVNEMYSFMWVYFVGLLGMLILLGMIILPKWKTTVLKREKKVICYLTIAYMFLVIVVVIDFILPMTGTIIFPLGPVAGTVFVGVLYWARKSLEKMNVNAEIASSHIYELIPIPILIIKADHTIVDANHFAGRFFDVDINEMIGKPLEEYVSSAFFPLQKRFREEIGKRREAYEVSVTCRTNRAVCGLKYRIVYDNYGECIYATLLLNDMSKQYAMFHKLEESRNRAEIANAAKSEFLANMSHEIRTPLNAILGMNEMIIREAREPGMTEYAENIKTAANTMVSMVNDILDMSKMESGRLEIVNAEYDMRSMLAKILDAVKEKFIVKNLALVWEIDSKIPSRLMGDEGRIRQVIGRFLSNAEKYTKEGSVTLRVKQEYLNSETINLLVEVEDTGIGINQEDMDKLFGTFGRVNLQENRSISGLGLGLSIVKNIVDAMDGKVSVESEYGKGSIFSCSIPQYICNPVPVGDFNEWYHSLAVLESGKEVRRICAPEARILAVDDTHVNLEVVKALLKRTEMQVDLAHSGQECLDMVKHKQYHVILMDHMMPEMDGIETLQQLKNMKDNLSKDAKVIVLTANAVAGARDSYLASGFDDYLKKPVKSLRLEQMLAQYLPAELLQIQVQDDALITTEEWAKRVNFHNINVRVGLGYTDNNHEMLLSIMKQYLNSGKKNIEEINRIFEQEDWKNYEILVHALKGTSLNIGAEKLSNHAKMLEAAVQKDRIEYIMMNHKRVMELYQTVLEELEEYFAEVTINTKPKNIILPEVSRERFLQLLNQLKDKLEISITTEIEKVATELKQYAYNGVDLKLRYKEIFECIEEYEYEKASAMVEEVIQNDV